MKQLHYCIFSAHYLPNFGGVERYTYNLAKKLIAAGNRVTVVASNMDNLPEDETSEGIRVLRMPCWSLLKGRFPVLKPNAEFRRLHRLLKEQNFDFVVIQTRFYVHSSYGALCARKMGLPMLAIEHGTNHFTVNSPVLDPLGQLYEHFASWVVSGCCKHFYGVSQACCDWLRHFKIQADGKLYNAVNVEEIQQKLDAAPVSYREKYDLGDSVMITYTGRLVAEKGIRKLVEAVELLRQQELKVKLLVAGAGELFDTLAQQNDPDVILLGRLDFDHVVALLKETDIFCLPTDYPEGFPTSVLEAAACKCYVVTTTRGGSRELILDDSYGTILENNTAQEIAAAISRAVQDENYRKAAAQKAYDRLCDTFTWDCTSAQVMMAANELTES